MALDSHEFVWYYGYIIMHRTTIMLPPTLHERATREAHEKGISLGQFIRDCLTSALLGERAGAGGDSLLRDKAVYRGAAPKDMAEEHDRYLYDEPK